MINPQHSGRRRRRSGSSKKPARYEVEATVSGRLIAIVPKVRGKDWSGFRDIAKRDRDRLIHDDRGNVWGGAGPMDPGG